jgi:DNA-directed RNA polymerase specialized sigma24 family protein
MPPDVRSDAFFDAHAARIYALALRITGSRELAGDVVEQLFIGLRNGSVVPQARGGSIEAWLVRTARDWSLARRPQGQTAAAAVRGTEGSPRTLVETAFFGGLSVDELARAFSLSEDEVRTRLKDGMAALHTQFAGTSLR